MAILPVLALGVSVLASKTRLPCWREAILAGAVAWGVLLVVSTEVLSALHVLTTTGLTVAWCMALVVGGLWILRMRTLRWPSVPEVDPAVAAIFGLLGLMVLVLGWLAVASAPNTWDAMTYHLARVIHWQEDASLAPYATHILRQLYLQPGAEYVLLHLLILSGGDRLAALVQWASMVGVLVGTSLLATQLGAGRAGTLCAIAFVASLPIGILESTSTQNDYVVTFWIVCLMLVALRLTAVESSERTRILSVALGVCLGLALLTKATAYLVAAPILVWVSISAIARLGLRVLPFMMVVGALAAALNGAFVVRNFAVFGSPVGPVDEGAPSLRYFNDALTPDLLISNVVRDVGINLVATPFVAVNVRSFQFVNLIHTSLGIDIQDPRSTWDDERFQEQPAEYAFNENFAGNPVHVVLLLLAVCLMWLLRGGLHRPVFGYVLTLVAAFLLFAAVLRWQPWHTRLELPLFVLGAPIVGVVAERIAPRVALGLAGVLVLSMLPWVLQNHARPLIGPDSVLSTTRTDQYFVYNPSLERAYVGVVGALTSRGCNQVGFVSNQDGWEYTLWALSGGRVRIEQVGVTNVSTSATTGATNFQPCAVVSVTSQSVDVMFSQ